MVQGGGLTTGIEQGSCLQNDRPLAATAAQLAQTLKRVESAKRPSSRRFLVSVASLLVGSVGLLSVVLVCLAIRNQVAPLLRDRHIRLGHRQHGRRIGDSQILCRHTVFLTLNIIKVARCLGVPACLEVQLYPNN